MGKPIDALDGLDTVVGDPHRDPLRVDRSDAFRFIQRCRVLELDPYFAFAYDTIAGIRCTVEITQVVSEGQRRAIQNIEVGVERRKSGAADRRDRQSGRSWRRRYEGRW